MEKQPDHSQLPATPLEPERYVSVEAVYRLGFDLAFEIGALTPEEADDHLQDGIDLRATNDYMLSIIPAELGHMTPAALAEHDVRLGAVCSQITSTIQGAVLLDGLARKLNEEIQRPDSPQVVSEILRTQGRVPLSNLLILQKAREYMLHDAGDVLGHLCQAMLEGAAPGISQGAKRKLDAMDVTKMEAYQLEPLEQARLVWREWAEGDRRVQTPTEQELLQVAPKLLLMYRDWSKLQKTKTGGKIGALPSSVFTDEPSLAEAEQPATKAFIAAPAETISPEPTSVEALIAGLESELAQLINMHQQRSKEFRPSWSQLKARFRRFEIALKNSPPGTGADRERFAEDSHRIVGLLAVLERSGNFGEHDEQAQAALQEKLIQFLTFEQAIRSAVRKVTNALRAADRQADLRNWQPLEADLALLKRHWDELEPHIATKWPDGGGSKAAQAITQVLRAFGVYEREIADPEGFLKAIATHIGATALRPASGGSNQAELTGTQHRYAMESGLDAVIANESLQQGTRQRAEVLRHFMIQGNESPRQGDDPAIGELLYLQPSREQPTPYFGVIFRTESGKEWIIIESLRYGTASYIFPKSIIDQQGVSVRQFIDTYNKDELQREGGIQIRHLENWTTASHKKRIDQRIVVAEGPVLPPYQE